MNRSAAMYVWRWGCWFRVFGYGLTIDRAKGYPKLFSERAGYSKPLYIFGLRIKGLKP